MSPEQNTLFRLTFRRCAVKTQRRAEAYLAHGWKIENAIVAPTDADTTYVMAWPLATSPAYPPCASDDAPLPE
ncbi:MAG TPA: hypothetical protein PLN52_19360 [Opitutaceae bacterium]|nr:hypothetical protein [Opitutaceae bacterium]